MRFYDYYMVTLDTSGARVVLFEVAIPQQAASRQPTSALGARFGHGLDLYLHPSVLLPALGNIV
jgi:hypothetical protein